MANQKLLYLINYLLSERPDIGGVQIPKDEEQQFRLYRSLVNIRPVMKADDEFLKMEDAYLEAIDEFENVEDVYLESIDEFENKIK